MKKIVIIVSALLLCVFYSSAYSANWVRSGKIVEKEFNEYGNSPLVFGYLTFPPSNENNCSWEDDGDLALNFDISILSRLAGSSFDVDNIYVDGVVTGEVALSSWLLAWKLSEGEYAIPPLITYDWSNRDIVSFCVGRMAQGGSIGSLENIILWYDGPVQTVFHKAPLGNEESSNENGGPMVDMTKVPGSKLVSQGQESDNESGTWNNEIGYSPPSSGSDSSGSEPDFKPVEVYIDHHRKVLRPGEDHEIFTRIKNKGNGSSPDDIRIKYWRSDGYNIDAKDDRVNLGTDNIQKENLPPGDSKWESKHVSAPSTPGTYNYTVEADDNEQIEESRESNNKFDPPFVFQVKKPDFYFANAYIVGGMTQFSPGYAFQIKVFTENDGAVPGPDVEVHYYLGGVKFGEDNMRDYNLEPEDPPKEESIYVVAPDTPGNYTVSACIDPADNVDEGNENNNCWSRSFVVESPPDPEPDYNISVSSVTAGSKETNIHAGEKFSIDAVVQNSGDTLPSNALLGYFLLGGELTEPLFLGSDTISPQDFPTTSFQSESLEDITVPGNPGVYEVQVCIDYDEQISESSETDNCRTIEIEVKKKHLNHALINIFD